MFAGPAGGSGQRTPTCCALAWLVAARRVSLDPGRGEARGGFSAGDRSLRPGTFSTSQALGPPATRMRTTRGWSAQFSGPLCRGLTPLGCFVTGSKESYCQLKGGTTR